MKLQHWQLFILFLVPYLALAFLAFQDITRLVLSNDAGSIWMDSNGNMMLWAVTASNLLTLAWRWLPSITLKSLLPDGPTVWHRAANIAGVLTLCIYGCWAYLGGSYVFGFESYEAEPRLASIIAAWLVDMSTYIEFGLIGFIGWVSGQSIASARLQRKASVSESVVFALLFLIPVVGVWYIQPKILELLKPEYPHPDVLDVPEQS